jgi:hypothetical protein
MSTPNINSVFEGELNIVNVGLTSFADNIVRSNGKVTQLSWQPPAGADPVAGMALAGMVNDERVAAANEIAYSRYLGAQPVLSGVALAKDVIEALGSGQRRILHAGPPIAWDDMCGPVQGAITGAILYEGWAEDLEAAKVLAASGEIALEPCHNYGAVGPMAGDHQSVDASVGRQERRRLEHRLLQLQ